MLPPPAPPSCGCSWICVGWRGTEAKGKSGFTKNVPVTDGVFISKIMLILQWGDVYTTLTFTKVTLRRRPTTDFRRSDGQVTVLVCAPTPAIGTATAWFLFNLEYEFFHGYPPLLHSYLPQDLIHYMMTSSVMPFCSHIIQQFIIFTTSLFHSIG